jgi:hypothetical protein
MTDSIAIRDKIIAILVAKNPKNVSGAGVTTWFKGQPPKSRWPGRPWGWVECAGWGAEAPTTSKQKITETFHIVIIDKAINQDQAEDSVLQFIMATRDAMKQEPTLSGMVDYSWFSRAEKEKNFDGDYSVVAIRLTLNTRRTE